MRPLKLAPNGWRERFAIAHREIMQIAHETAPAREAMRLYYLAHPPAPPEEAWGEPMKYQSASTAIPQFRPPEISRAALAGDRANQ